MLSIPIKEGDVSLVVSNYLLSRHILIANYLCKLLQDYLISFIEFVYSRTESTRINRIIINLI